MLTTPPNLLGMERRMAYAHRKYHSGLIWVGVTRGLAGRKFSGSVSEFGVKNLIVASVNVKPAIPIISLMVKYEWKGVLRGLA